MYKEKLEYMIEVGRQIRNARAALAITVGELKPLRKGAKYTLSLPEAEIKWEGDLKSLKDEAKYTFQKAYEYLNGMDPALDVGVSLERVDFDSSMPPPHNPRLLQPDFQFSDDSKVFSSEFRHVRWLFAYTKGKDEKVDFLAMRALFHAGRILKGIEMDGEVRSNRPTKGGHSKRKGYIDEQVYSELFYSIDVGRKSREDVCNRIIAEATKQEKNRAKAKSQKPKNILTIRSIRRILKTDLDKLFS